MAKGVDARAMAAAQAAAAGLVKTWTVDQLEQPAAADRLASSWGLAPSTTRGLITTELQRRRLAPAA